MSIFLKKTKGMTIYLLLMLTFLLVGCSTESSVESKDSGLPDDYPNKNIDALVGFEAGGGQDVLMRSVGEILNEEGIIDQPFVIENKPGAGGIIAAKEHVKRKDDPYLLQVMPEYGAGWDSRADAEFEDFKPIASIATSDIYIVVKDDAPYKDINELFDALKNDDSLTISTLGPADGGEAFKWDQLRDLIGADRLNYVPMQGAVDSFTAVLSGQVDVTFGVLPVIKDYVETEEIRPLAVLSEQRTEALPDVPTLKESDIDFAYSRFTGLWTGADVPDDVVQFWEKKLAELTETDSWETFLNNRGLSPFYKNTKEYTELIEKEGTDFAEFIDNID